MMSEKEFREGVAKRLHGLRERDGLSMQALSREVPISQAMISLIENGKCSPGIYVLYLLANFYGVSIDWLMTGRGYRNA